MKLDLPLAAALTNLRGSSDFKLFITALQKMADDETEKALDQTETLLIGRSQGRARVLKSVVKTVADAPSILDKLKPK